MNITRRLLATAAACLIGLQAHAAELPTSTAEDVGMARLDRIDAFFQAEIAAKRLPGAVVMIAREGRVVHHAAYGLRDPATGAPMGKDSIFRIYSMTKPVTAVAVLMLMEEGKRAFRTRSRASSPPSPSPASGPRAATCRRRARSPSSIFCATPPA